ncbi:MAG: L-serine ammonia-lyase, iron-sulfur-dependent, subunit alpha [Candidatus Hodarchaeales archaeon]
MRKIATYIARANKQKVPLSSIVIEREANRHSVTEEKVISGMEKTYTVMRNAIIAPDPYETYIADITGDIAGQFQNYRKRENSITGNVITEVIERALIAGKNNSMMNVIVAAPTAGSSGVLPAVLTVMEDLHGVPRDKIVRSLFTAGLVAKIIADSVTLAGASGGCMAECGSASAMAAAAIVELRDGTPEQCSNAAALALKQHLGLACDPIAGVVECPCIKRNAFSATTSLVAADMSLAGVYSVVSFDEVMLAMKDIARKMDSSLRETSNGGLATTPTGKWWKGRIKM